MSGLSVAGLETYRTLSAVFLFYVYLPESVCIHSRLKT